MRIGIDIDDTITNTWETLMPIFSKRFNRTLDENLLPYYYQLKDLITIDEYFNIMREYEDILKDVSLKENVVNIINKLKSEGNEIIFITARNKGYSDPYNTTIKYLEKNNILYDKLIIDSWDKDEVCKKESIDLFIDDSYKHCKEVSKLGIDVLMIKTKYNKDICEFNMVDNWNSIYEYIKNR